MKINRILFLFLMFPAVLLAQEIKWMSFEEAIEAQKKAPKKIIMDVYTNWCGPCRLMDKKTFGHPDVASYINKNFYAVKFNAEGNELLMYKGKSYTNPNYRPELANERNYQHQFAEYMQIMAYPSVVFLDEQGEFISPVTGYKSPKQMEMYLKVFSTDAYKKIQTSEDWQAYQQKFKNEFND